MDGLSQLIGANISLAMPRDLWENSLVPTILEGQQHRYYKNRKTSFGGREVSVLVSTFYVIIQLARPQGKIDELEERPGEEMGENIVLIA